MRSGRLHQCGPCLRHQTATGQPRELLRWSKRRPLLALHCACPNRHDCRAEARKCSCGPTATALISTKMSPALEHYSATSRYFMAARFDANRANASRFRTGDGIPTHIEMPLDRPWVPLAGARPHRRRQISFTMRACLDCVRLGLNEGRIGASCGAAGPRWVRSTVGAQRRPRPHARS